MGVAGCLWEQELREEERDRDSWIFIKYGF